MRQGGLGRVRKELILGLWRGLCGHQPTNLPTNQSNQYIPKTVIEGEGCMEKEMSGKGKVLVKEIPVRSVFSLEQRFGDNRH